MEISNDWEKALIQELKSFAACKRSLLGMKLNIDHFAELLRASADKNSKSFYEYHIGSLELKLAKATYLVTRLERGLAILSVTERKVLFELYIAPSGKKKVGSQGQVYRLKNRAVKKLFAELNYSLQ